MREDRWTGYMKHESDPCLGKNLVWYYFFFISQYVTLKPWLAFLRKFRFKLFRINLTLHSFCVNHYLELKRLETTFEFIIYVVRFLELPIPKTFDNFCVYPSFIVRIFPILYKCNLCYIIEHVMAFGHPL